MKKYSSTADAIVDADIGDAAQLVLDAVRGGDVVAASVGNAFAGDVAACFAAENSSGAARHVLW